MNKSGFTITLEQLVKIILYVIVFFAFLFVFVGQLWGAASKGPDSVQKDGMKRLAKEIVFLIDIPQNYVTTKRVTFPLQLSEKFKLASFQSDFACHNRPCICLVDKEDIDSRYFCEEFKVDTVFPILYFPEKNQLINIEIIVQRTEDQKTLLTLVPTEIAKQNPLDYLDQGESDEAAISGEDLDPGSYITATGIFEKYNPFGTKTYPISSTFGKFRTIGGNAHHHAGVDFAAPCGINIYAVEEGVAKPLVNPGGYGNYVVIAHKNEVSTAYAHLSESKVTNNQQVKKGDLIGISGKTGVGTGCHLHFEVRHAPGTSVQGTHLANNAVDPKLLANLLGTPTQTQDSPLASTQTTLESITG